MPEPTSFHRRLAPLLFVSLPALCGAGEAVPVSHQLSLGAYYSEGDYGAEDSTRLRYLPVSYEFSRFPWVLNVTVPWIGLSGPGDVFLETGNVGASRPGDYPPVDDSGVGDVLLGASYQFESMLGGFAFADLSLQAKLPTADEDRDLGTGEIDLSYQVDLYRALDHNTLFATLGYRHRGKTALYDLRDGGYLSLGLLRDVDEQHGLGLLYDYREAASSESSESHELMPFYTFSPVSRWRFMVYTVFGFTDSSPDRTLGLQMSYSW